MTYKEYMSLLNDKIIIALENGINPWQVPWTGAFNGVTKRPYNGANSILLTLLTGFTYDGDFRWYTFDQAKKLGCRIKSGEKATPALFFNNSYKVEKLDEKGNPILDEHGLKVFDTISIPPVFKVYYVFNAKQLYPEPPELVLNTNPNYNVEKAETILTNSPVDITFTPISLAGAYYNPHSDNIVMPAKNNFPNSEEFYSTAFHEMAHATAAPTRLSRTINTNKNSKDYAIEELIAEITSVSLCEKCDIKYTYANSASYIASWLSHIKDPDFKLDNLYSDISKASRFLMYPENRDLLHNQAIKKNTTNTSNTQENQTLFKNKSFRRKK